MPGLNVSNADGDTLVAAPAGRGFIRVLGGELTASAESVMSLLSDGTTVWETYAAGDANQGIVVNVGSSRTIDCAPGEALKLGATGGATVKGFLEYIILGPPPS